MCGGIRQDTVYPRVCGGTDRSNKEARPHVQEGLSPRVRGNPIRLSCLHERRQGSIPACAGEPRVRPVLQLERQWVYPRVCGGTSTVHIEASARSIPACAGEPFRRCGSGGGLSPRVRGNLQRTYQSPEQEVYPRVCGGTSQIASRYGLSPRVRGKPRSIPACAGEPEMR